VKLKLRIHKDGTALYEGIHDVCDAASFGKAWADVWIQLHECRLASASSIGDLYEKLNDRLIDDLCDAEISLSKE
jgi:hypothetical protein